MGFWKDKRVLVTGHTGFKGSWLCELLLHQGAEVYGLSLPPPPGRSLFEQLRLAGRIDHHIGDIRDADVVAARVRAVRPGIVLHLAAQSLVLASYREPLATWATNVMGTAHLLDAIGRLDVPCAVVVVTTDKVYENREARQVFTETDPLGGHDPYSASKAACELVTSSYRAAFPSRLGRAVATARSGNVIGGGDWSENRMLPDLARAFEAGRPLILRNPDAVRPWQHVLDPLHGYLRLAEFLSGDDSEDFATAFNFGPDPSAAWTVRALIDLARRDWPGEVREETDPSAPREAGHLVLESRRARERLSWTPRWNIEASVGRTVAWYRGVAEGGDPADITRAQVAEFGKAA